MTSTSPGSSGAGPLDAPRALALVARASAGAGLVAALLTVAFLGFVLVIADPSLGAWTLTGFGCLCVGALLWSASQVTVGRWVLGRDDAALLGAVPTGLVAVVVGALGAGVVVGTPSAAVLVLLVVGLVACAETVLVTRARVQAEVAGQHLTPADLPPAVVPERAPAAGSVDPRVPGQAESRTPAAVALAALATVAVSFGTGVGILALAAAVVYAPVPDFDWDALVAILALGVALVAAVWTLPHVAVLWWLGRKGAVARRGVLLGALATAVVLGLWISTTALTPEPWLWTMLVVTVGLPLAELAVAAAVLGSRGSVPRGAEQGGPQ